jgi:hypothetical protein
MDVTEQRWRGRAKSLATAPAAVLERIRAVQPWALPEPTQSALHVLNRLNNEDKHRRLVTIEAGLRGVLMPKMEDEVFYADARLIDSEARPRFGTGQLLGRFENARPFSLGVSMDRLQLAPRLKVTLDDTMWELSGLIRVLLEVVEKVQNWVIRGGVRPPMMMGVVPVDQPGAPSTMLTRVLYADEADSRSAFAGQ